MINLSSYLYQKSTIPIALSFTVLMILYASVVMGSQSECTTSQLDVGQSLLGLSFGYDQLEVDALLAKLDEKSLRCYLTLLQVWDNIFPLIYGTMYVLWLSVIYKKLIPGKTIPLNLFPLIPVLVDWTENFFEANIIRSYLVSGTVSPEAISTASFITQLKWSASMVNYVLILTGVAILLVKRFLKKRNQK